MSLPSRQYSLSQLPPATWRLIKSEPAAGSWNMAVDEAILEAAREGRVPPTLRLYAWQPACLSLGYAQHISDVDLAALKARGWDLVRRPTGGRAILHTDELTYSVTGPENEPRLSGDIVSSYQRLSAAILAALQSLELGVQALPHQKAERGLNGQPVCFEIPSNYEITIGGKKLVGSAQARKKGGVLQHGTLPLYGDLTRITQVLTFEDDQARQVAASRLLERASTVEAALGHPVSWEDAAEVFTSSFAGKLNLTFEENKLTPAELERAEELETEKYSNPEWSETR
jgi:lipoate-protein ligase A